MAIATICNLRPAADCLRLSEQMNIALHRFLHNHGNIASEGYISHSAQ